MVAGQKAVSRSAPDFAVNFAANCKYCNKSALLVLCFSERHRTGTSGTASLEIKDPPLALDPVTFAGPSASGQARPDSLGKLPLCLHIATDNPALSTEYCRILP